MELIRIIQNLECFSVLMHPKPIKISISSAFCIRRTDRKDPYFSPNPFPWLGIKWFSYILKPLTIFAITKLTFTIETNHLHSKINLIGFTSYFIQDHLLLPVNGVNTF